MLHSLYLRAALTCALALPIAAQSTGASFSGAALEGETLVLTIACADGWHVYPVASDDANKTLIELKDGPRKIGGAVGEPKPKHHRKVYEGGYVEEYDYHDGVVVFRVPLAATGTAGTKIEGSISWNACNDEGCLPEKTEQFSVALGAGGAESRPTTRPAEGKTRKVDRPKPDPEQRGSDPLTFVSITTPESVEVGVPFNVVLAVRVKPPWHIYGVSDVGGVSQPTTFDVAPVEEGGAKRAKIAGAPKADMPPRFHGAGEDRYAYHEGAVAFTVPVVIEGGGAATAEKFRFVVNYQACTMEQCLPPTDAGFDIEVAVTVAAGAAPRVEEAPPRAVQEPRVEKPKPTSTADASAGPVDPAILRPGIATFVPPTIEAGAELVATIIVMPPVGKDLATASSARVFLEGGVEFERLGDPKVEHLADGRCAVSQRFRASPEIRNGDVVVQGVVELGGTKTAFEGKIKILTSLWAFLGIAMLAAGVALLTPCVFPMIPVTVAFFTKQAERTGGKNPWALGLLYAFGIVTSFTLIGLAFTAALGPTGASVFAQHRVTQGLIALLFIVFGLSLMGAFEIQLPAFLQNMIGSAQGKGGVAGILMMGALFSLTTFTCTAAFVGAILAEAASSGDYFRPTMGMLAFSAVLAAPFIFLSAFPSYVKKMPRAGGWMNEVKVVMGLVEIAAAFKFLNGLDVDIFNRTVTLVFTVAIFGVCGLYLLGTFRMPHDSPRERTSVTHAVLAIGCFTLSIYLAGGVSGAPLNTYIDGYLPLVEEQKNPERRIVMIAEKVAERVGSVEGGAARAPIGRTGFESAFKDDYLGAVAESKRLDLPLFIDFTGFT